jgi:hypothetical protein
MPRGLHHVALSISFLSPMARRPDAFFATNMASLILRPDLRFLDLTSFHSRNPPNLSSGSSSRISLRRQSFSVSRRRLRPPGNIHRLSRLLLTSKTRPRFAATSLDDFAITVLSHLATNRPYNPIPSFEPSERAPTSPRGVPAVVLRDRPAPRSNVSGRRSCGFGMRLSRRGETAKCRECFIQSL